MYCFFQMSCSDHLEIGRVSENKIEIVQLKEELK